MYDTEREPDGVLLKACGTRRESRCPSCAATYRADAYQLLAAGLKGGKGVPETIGQHPRLFVTFTAPSFGRVHTRKAQGRLVLPCHPHRQGARCPHGMRDGCWHRHDEDDPRLGEPLCPACYDAQAQVLWNALAPELWRRTTIAVQRALGRLVGLEEAELRQAGPRLLCEGGRVPAARGDPLPRRHPPGRGHRLPLPWLPGPTPRAIHRRPPRGRPPAGRPGRPGALPALDEAGRAGMPAGVSSSTSATSPTASDQAGELSAEQVAGYIAKYATKATESFGSGLDRRLTADDLDRLDQLPAHVAKLVRAAWELGGRPELEGLRLRAWAHMLGFGGHWSTKSRRYSTTLTALRRARVAFAKRRRARDGIPLDAWEPARGRPGRDRRRLLGLRRLRLCDRGRALAGAVGRRPGSRTAAGGPGGTTHHDGLIRRSWKEVGRGETAC